MVEQQSRSAVKCNLQESPEIKLYPKVQLFRYARGVSHNTHKLFFILEMEQDGSIVQVKVVVSSMHKADLAKAL